MVELRQTAPGVWAEVHPERCPSCGADWTKRGAFFNSSAGAQSGRIWTCKACGVETHDKKGPATQ